MPAAIPSITPQATETVYPSGPYASPATEALDRHRLTEEIRQVVQADLMPKALSSAQLHDRINKSVARAFNEHLASFRSEIDERFQRLAATPETKDFVRREPAPPAAPAIDIPALLGEFEQRLDARTAGIARSTAQAINDAITGIDQRLNQLADPERLRQQIAGAVDDAVRNGLATIELQRQESAARHAVGDVEAQARDRATIDRLATAVDHLDQTVATKVATAMAGATEAIAGPIRELVGEVLAKSTPPNLEAVTQKLAHELRADLDWQVERLAAERGWVSIADVQAEVARSGGGPAAPAPTHTFARLEAALVEFVHQSQVQQQQFLGVLQQRVEQSTENVTKSLVKALADENHRSSALFRSPQQHLGGDERHAALESLVPRPPADLDLDVLSQTAQHRAISSLSVPPPHSTAAFLPGTLAGRTMTAPNAGQGQEETSQTLRLEPTGSEVDAAAPTLPSLDGGSELGLEAVEMAPLTSQITNPAANELRDDLATTILPPLAAETFAEAEPDEAKPASGSIQREAGTDRQAALDPAPPQAGASSGTSVAIAPLTSHVALTTDAFAAAPEPVIRPVTAPQTPVPNASELEPETAPPSTVRAAADVETSAQLSGTHVVEPLTANASQPAPTGTVSGAAKTATTTTRVGALEAGLRTLVRSEIERQLSGGLRDTLRQALGLDQPAVTPAVLAAHVEEALTKAMAERDQLSGATQLSSASLAPTEANDGNRSALTMPWAPGPHGREDLVRLLREPGVRQEILGIVAVEVLANPGALAELSGIRAFIRNEVGNAARELAESPLAKGSTLHGDPALA